ncbi:hypothetical protein K8Q93_00565 [Candidatus Parcubacteria bacterium]|nr:hypothetical protein [Candidatus Parcubacteria bacterium]
MPITLVIERNLWKKFSNPQGQDDRWELSMHEEAESAKNEIADRRINKDLKIFAVILENPQEEEAREMVRWLKGVALNISVFTAFRNPNLQAEFIATGCIEADWENPFIAIDATLEIRAHA